MNKVEKSKYYNQTKRYFRKRIELILKDPERESVRYEIAFTYSGREGIQIRKYNTNLITFELPVGEIYKFLNTDEFDIVIQNRDTKKFKYLKRQFYLFEKTDKLIGINHMYLEYEMRRLMPVLENSCVYTIDLYVVYLKGRMFS